MLRHVWIQQLKAPAMASRPVGAFAKNYWATGYERKLRKTNKGGAFINRVEVWHTLKLKFLVWNWNEQSDSTFNDIYLFLLIWMVVGCTLSRLRLITLKNCVEPIKWDGAWNQTVPPHEFLWFSTSILCVWYIKHLATEQKPMLYMASSSIQLSLLRW